MGLNRQQQKFQDEMIRIAKEAYDQGAKDVIATMKAVIDYCPNDTAALVAMRRFIKEHS